MENPQLLAQFLREQGARDTTGRATGLDELTAMTPHLNQHMPGEEIPEKSWAYWIAKRLWFNDYGAYAKHFQP